MHSYLYGRDGFVWFTGVVEDRNDPEKLGRVRVRIFSYHTKNKTDIPTEDLQWSHIIYPVTTPSMDGMGNTPSFLVEGSQVFGFFRDPDAFQEPMILGSIPGVASTKSKPSEGFNDPNGKYPKKINEPDTNRLAANNPQKRHQVLNSKENDLTENVSSADGTSWSEPSSTYNASYPKNHVFESESGHIVEFDDTPNSERIHEYHKSGTFYEIDAEGNKVTRVVGDNYEIVAGNDYVNIKGNANIHVNGDCNISSDGNMKFKAGNAALQPSVLGDDLSDVIKEIVSILSGLDVIVPGSPPGTVGPAASVKLAKLKVLLNRKPFLSKTIENN